MNRIFSLPPHAAQMSPVGEACTDFARRIDAKVVVDSRVRLSPA